MILHRFTNTIAFVALALVASSAPAITVANGNPASQVVSFNQSVDGVNLNGEVEIISSGIGGFSGSLLSDGTSILTAGHCVSSFFGGYMSSDVQVYFPTTGGLSMGYTAVAVDVDPLWTGDATQGGDLAVIQLGQQAPASATRYALDTQIPTTAAALLDGYGDGGTGAAGYDDSLYPFGTLRAGTNAFEETGSAVGWSSTLLVGQFYESGVPSTNVLGVANPYSASNEVDIAPGDSGGGAFQDGAIVAVNDLIACESTGCTPDSSFGGIFADTSVYANLSWIEAQEAPEPGTLALMTGALLGIWLIFGRRARV